MNSYPYRKTNFLNVPIGDRDPEEVQWEILHGIMDVYMLVFGHGDINMNRDDVNGLYVLADLSRFLIDRTGKIP